MKKSITALRVVSITESVTVAVVFGQILLSEGVPHPFGIAVHRDLIYWTDWVTHNIESADKLNGSRRQVVYSGHEDLMDVHVFNRQRPAGISPNSTTAVSS